MTTVLIIALLIILALLILPTIFWILKVIRLSKNEDKTGMWVVLAVGLFLSPLIGLLVGLAFKEDDADKAKEREREREREREFWCGICNIKFPADFLGGETIYEGKVCRSCLGKRQRGEATNPPENQPKTKYNESFEPKDRYKSSLRDSSEMRILLRELSRKQSKKSRHLTSFIINLAILQWLLPLITYLAFWIQLKENIKVQALNNPGMGLTTEIPFSTVIKDFFKILTSETYVYGGHNFQISILWKIGIVLVFLIPLGIWIYNLIGFFSAKGEVERLETEIKAIER